MGSHYVGIGFGMRGIECAKYIYQILRLSIAECKGMSATDSEATGLVVAFPDGEDDDAVLEHFSPDDMVTTHESPLYLLMLVDESDPSAIEAAAMIGARARGAGVYLTMAVCVGGLLSSASAEFERMPELHNLRQAVDSLVLVNSTLHAATDYPPGARVALALISAILPGVINLICTDVADLKQVLHGYVIANVVYTEHGKLSHEVAIQNTGSRINVTNTGFTGPKGLFCSYSASQNDATLADFESIGALVHEAMDMAYPDSDIDLIAACLLDKSLENAIEVITCISYPDATSP